MRSQSKTAKNLIAWIKQGILMVPWFPVHGIKGVHAADEEYKLFDVEILQSSKDIHDSLGKGYGWAVTFRGPE